MIKEEPLFSSLRTIAGLMSFLERDKNLSELLENSEKRIEYTDIKEVSNKLPPGFLGLEKKAFVFDEETGKCLSLI